MLGRPADFLPNLTNAVQQGMQVHTTLVRTELITVTNVPHTHHSEHAHAIPTDQAAGTTSSVRTNVR